MPQQRRIILLMGTVQQEGVAALPTADAAGLPRQLPQGSADGAQQTVAELPAVLLIDRVKAVHVADDGVQRRVPVDMVEAGDVAEEIVPVQQSRELVALRVADQVTVLGQLDALGDTGLYSCNSTTV